MSSHDPSNAPVKRDAREALRAKAQQVQAQQSRRRLVQRSLMAVAGLAVIAVIAGSLVWVFSNNASQPQLAPTNVTDNGFAISSVSGVAGAGAAATLDATATPEVAATEPDAEADATAAAGESAAVDIRVYVDYLSEGSRTFQMANMSQLASWVEDGSATLTYHPVAMLSAKSNGTKYSLRAASAAACVATHSSDAFFAYTNELLTRQPAVDADGMSDKELADLAQASGVEAPKEVRACIEEGRFAAWARTATDNALEGIPGTDDLALTGTPTVLVNGEPYVGALDDPAEFAQFVMTLASDAYFRESSTPSPTPTPAS
ncbi:DsbA family protein [Microbacterium sp. zg.Y1090]|uniref:DsbA family protein n=1 Tax=Microbacterium TaxID=33882 RepID=UPI00214B43E6|nr:MULTISPECIES: DsbA family protein [unclassified Microbacterium]MCR2812834.1 DsbA family protein [Microbacterium sp. zg.Y1084]MCR2817363.1 DsbA family protein [Microbacterium sp. zg.Y1090]MDL5485978.1 DsbA family protein [Microbacterium sp. zg-Y1211]WIM29150.1 DsbA family protein [Microbacterium sp. zg-Y1090]